MGENIVVAGFSTKGRRPLVDREEVTEANGEVNYLDLARRIDELGNRLIKEARLLERI